MWTRSPAETCWNEAEHSVFTTTRLYPCGLAPTVMVTDHHRSGLTAKESCVPRTHVRDFHPRIELEGPTPLRLLIRLSLYLLHLQCSEKELHRRIPWSPNTPNMSSFATFNRVERWDFTVAFNSTSLTPPSPRRETQASLLARPSTRKSSFEGRPYKWRPLQKAVD